ncbi:MAG: toll/interleukin-1 receptor domain-containing protein [Pseudomonadota bacterium]
MALLKGYRNDVFISYAHHDNPPDPLGGDGAVTRLVAFLEGMIPQRMGTRGDYKIFFDHRDLKANHEIEHALEEARQSAIFVAITSPAYVADKSWALREMETFVELPDSKQRFFSLEVLPIDGVRTIPQVFNERKRYKFWDDGGAENKVAMQLHPKIHPIEYTTQLTAFAEQIAEVMRRIVDFEGEGPDDQPPAEEKPPIGTVLLTQANDDVEFERVKVASFLAQANVRVLPEYDYPQGGEDFKEAFAEDLEDADLVVQLLGRAAGRMPKDLPMGYQHHQHHAALEADKPLIAWRHPEIDPSEVASEVQRELLESKNTVNEGLETFRGMALEALEKAVAPPPPPPPTPVLTGTGPVNTAMIYLSADKADRELAQTLFSALADRNHPVALPMFDGETADAIQQDIDRNMTESDKIVVVQGKAPTSWVRSNLVRANKARAMRRQPPELTALFKAPPPPKDSPNVMLPDLAELDSSDELDLEKFCAFVEKTTGPDT